MIRCCRNPFPRTEVGQQGSVKGIKHSQVEGYGPSTAHRHIIHSNQN